MQLMILLETKLVAWLLTPEPNLNLGIAQFAKLTTQQLR
jgi:hypothetical protein